MGDDVVDQAQVDKWYAEVIAQLQGLNKCFSEFMMPMRGLDPAVPNCTFMGQLKLQEFSHWVNDAMIALKRHTPEVQDAIVDQAVADGKVRIL